MGDTTREFCLQYIIAVELKLGKIGSSGNGLPISFKSPGELQTDLLKIADG
jgi:hypothetical protein